LIGNDKPGYDLLALKYIKHPLPCRKTAPIHIPSAVHLPVASLSILGSLARLPSFLYPNLFQKNHFRLFNHDFSIPGFRLFGSQMIVALLGWFVTGYIFKEPKIT